MQMRAAITEKPNFINIWKIMHDNIMKLVSTHRVSMVKDYHTITARVKGEVYKVAVRPVMLYGLETVALTKRQEAEMKMLRFSLGVKRMDKIRRRRRRTLF